MKYDDRVGTVLATPKGPTGDLFGRGRSRFAGLSRRRNWLPCDLRPSRCGSPDGGSSTPPHRWMWADHHPLLTHPRSPMRSGVTRRLTLLRVCALIVGGTSALDAQGLSPRDSGQLLVALRKQVRAFADEWADAWVSPASNEYRNRDAPPLSKEEPRDDHQSPGFFGENGRRAIRCSRSISSTVTNNPAGCSDPIRTSSNRGSAITPSVPVG